MAVFRSFKALRPAADKARAVAALPYDVVNREEARAIGEKNPLSFLHVDRPEMDLEPSIDLYDERVYAKARENLDNLEKEGILVQDENPCYYIYEQVRKGRTQTGIVGCSSIDDYMNGVVKKHELTREDKEQDRIHHVDSCNANTGPIFLACRYPQSLLELMEDWKKSHPAACDFTEEDEITHRVWVIDDAEMIGKIHEEFAGIDSLYIADGHHRAASAVKVGLKRREQNPGYTGEEEFNYFLSVLFPDEELQILDYNRVIRDLNGRTPKELLQEAEKVFEVRPCAGSGEALHAELRRKGELLLYLANRWYHLTIRPEYRKDDPVDGLDVSILQDAFLYPVLGIGDPKTDPRIGFVGGIRGYQELERRVHEDCAAAFAMYPTSIQELFAVADTGRLMPPKSTWFEPKLRSGLYIHAF